MKIFGENKPKNSDERWKRLWEVKAAIGQLAKEEKQLEADLVEDAKELWDGQTAHFDGGNKIRMGNRPKLVFPKAFDKAAFMEARIDLTKLSIDESKVIKEMEKDGEFAGKYELEVELVQSFKFERS